MPENCPLLGRFPTLMGRFPECLNGPFSLLKIPWKTVHQEKGHDEVHEKTHRFLLRLRILGGCHPDPPILAFLDSLAFLLAMISLFFLPGGGHFPCFSKDLWVPKSTVWRGQGKCKGAVRIRWWRLLRSGWVLRHGREKQHPCHSCVVAIITVIMRDWSGPRNISELLSLQPQPTQPPLPPASPGWGETGSGGGLPPALAFQYTFSSLST